MIEYNHQIKETEISVFSRYDKKAHKKVVYSRDIFTLDIEVSSGWIKDGEVTGYEAGKDSEYWNSLQPVSLPYIWQFSWNDRVYYGREFSKLNQVFKDIGKRINVIVWVHNLAYEFQFLCNILHWKNVFARSPRKVIKATSEEFPNIEFRCSYFLTRLSLAAWGEQIGLPKMIGDLDYEVLRTPLTELTAEEMKYCERDCEVVYHGIKEYLKTYTDQWDIPLTQTGTVRRVVKEKLMKDATYRKHIKKLVPSSVERYQMLQAVFSGGYTHANRVHAGIVQTGKIGHGDFTSRYPTDMFAEKYPMSPWAYTGSHEIPPDSEFENKAFIMHLTFSKLNCKTYNTYIQASKCISKNTKFDNGRVMKADELHIWITEQDWLTIRDTYTWESVTVNKLYESRKGYLPKPFLEYILELYENKTRLKGVEGEEDLYLQSKQYINSLFGMMVTAILQADVELKGDEWIVKELTKEDVEEYLKKISDWHDREQKYFLSYSWGCWVTAYARRALWRLITSIDYDVIYCDTDSIFYLGDHDFTWYNNEITEKLRKSCEVNGLDFERTRPKDKKGIEHPLGIFDKEPDCTEFVTLGAKRYVERRENDGNLHLTVSGINKDAVALLHDNIYNFRENFDFDKDSLDEDGNCITVEHDGITMPCVRKQLPTYLTDIPTVVWPDGYVSTYRYGINMRRNGYKLTMTDEYKALINYMDTMNDIPEQYWVSRRGKFR